MCHPKTRSYIFFRLNNKSFSVYIIIEIPQTNNRYPFKTSCVCAFILYWAMTLLLNVAHGKSFVFHVIQWLIGFYLFLYFFICAVLWYFLGKHSEKSSVITFSLRIVVETKEQEIHRMVFTFNCYFVKMETDYWTP